MKKVLWVLLIALLCVAAVGFVLRATEFDEVSTSWIGLKGTYSNLPKTIAREEFSAVAGATRETREILKNYPKGYEVDFYVLRVLMDIPVENLFHKEILDNLKEAIDASSTETPIKIVSDMEGIARTLCVGNKKYLQTEFGTTKVSVVSASSEKCCMMSFGVNGGWTTQTTTFDSNGATPTDLTEYLSDDFQTKYMLISMERESQCTVVSMRNGVVYLDNSTYFFVVYTDDGEIDYTIKWCEGEISKTHGIYGTETVFYADIETDALRSFVRAFEELNPDHLLEFCNGLDFKYYTVADTFNGRHYRLEKDHSGMSYASYFDEGKTVLQKVSVKLHEQEYATFTLKEFDDEIFEYVESTRNILFKDPAYEEFLRLVDDGDIAGIQNFIERYLRPASPA